MRLPLTLSLTVTLCALALPARASGFSFTFEWGDIPLCTTGYPNTVPNPVFHLKNVPAGTKFIRFTLKDLDVPSYDHGGGTVPYAGQATIAPGAFTYHSPCPPGGRHTYEWTAVAKTNDSASGGTLDAATASSPYP
jgi:hypothetical protein